MFGFGILKTRITVHQQILEIMVDTIDAVDVIEAS